MDCDAVEAGCRGYGKFYLFEIDPATGQRVLRAEGSNTWAYTWADAAARLFAGADPAYKITSMLIEYANLPALQTTLAPPVIQRSDGIAYYLNLSSDSMRDYIRVPLLYPPMLGQDPAYPGTQFLSSTQYNQLTFEALTAGNVGINGKAFTTVANSVITGVALVATPVPSDHTQDVVCFRGYYSTANQVLLPPSGAFAVTYQETFT